MLVTGEALFTCRGCRFIKNAARKSGGALFVDARIDISDAEFMGNSAKLGG